MSSPIAIWIDSTQAKLFTFTDDGVQSSILKPHGPTHRAEVYGKNHTKAEGDSERFYHQVAEALLKSPGSKWYVMGSGLGHTHFCHHIEKHHPRFQTNILGSKAVDQITDNQIVAEAKLFFREKGLMA